MIKNTNCDLERANVVSHKVRVRERVRRRTQLPGEPEPGRPSAPLFPRATCPTADAVQADEFHEVVTAKTLPGHQYGAVQRGGIDDFKGRRKRASFAVFADFWLDTRSSTPLWHQLYQQLRQSIISRRLPSGTRLPSTRLLAEVL